MWVMYGGWETLVAEAAETDNITAPTGMPMSRAFVKRDFFLCCLSIWSADNQILVQHHLRTHVADLHHSTTVYMTRFQLILPVDSQNPPNFKVVIEW